MEKLILANNQSPGDIVVLTAALRDLHRSYPGRFLTDVRTPCPDLWLHNPYITPLKLEDPEVRVVSCSYPLVHESNRRPVHLLDGFIAQLNQQLNVEIQATELKGDIHLTEEEIARPPGFDLNGEERGPFWVIVAGGKYDFTIKWWHFRRWQAVVNGLRDRVRFVQVGEHGHHHPKLDGVIDLRGRTTLRQLVCLIYHARGVVCPITCAMHLAQAVPTKPGWAAPRSCVVVAGGREPVTWFSYPNHRVLHTVGRLSCCATGGCWRSRIVPLGDGLEFDVPQQLCTDVIGGLPHCMDLISPADVCAAIEECESQSEGFRALEKPLGGTQDRAIDQEPSWKHEFNTSFEASDSQQTLLQKT